MYHLRQDGTLCLRPLAALARQLRRECLIFIVMSEVNSTTYGLYSGNNVISYKLKGTEKSTTSESSSTLNFNYSFDASKDPAGNLDAARVNAFYVANTVHDFFHRYGFVEAAFNFQVCNFNRGGKGGDRVEMSIQETTIQDSFSAPPEYVQEYRCHHIRTNMRQ